jgi:hypothetical protein
MNKLFVSTSLYILAEIFVNLANIIFHLFEILIEEFRLRLLKSNPDLITNAIH